MNVVTVIKKVVAPLQRRVMSMISRGIVVLVNDSTKIQTTQVSVMAGEVQSNVERLQQFGFTSVPLPGAEAVVLYVGGSRDHGVVIAADNRQLRITSLKPGEACVYNSQGDLVHVKAGEILIKHSLKVKVESSQVEIGTEGLEKVLMGETFKAAFEAHTHIGNLGAPTGTPVQPLPLTTLSQTVKIGL
jgi:phage baseplate assembly protein V